jgi:hypothetical protein
MLCVSLLGTLFQLPLVADKLIRPDRIPILDQWDQLVGVSTGHLGRISYLPVWAGSDVEEPLEVVLYDSELMSVIGRFLDMEPRTIPYLSDPVVISSQVYMLPGILNLR